MTWTLILHGVVAFFYGALAVLSLLIRLRKWWETALARLGGAAFFLGCGAHHLDMLKHINEGTPLDATAAHHLIPGVMQAIGAPMFIFAAGAYIPSLLLILRTREREREVDHDTA